MAALKHFYRDLGNRLWSIYRPAQRLQAIRKLGLSYLYGLEPGSDCGHGRKLSHWPDLGAVHVDSEIQSALDKIGFQRQQKVQKGGVNE
jgi:hypothetical protein